MRWQAYSYSAVELRHLRYFVAVAEMENVSRAAMQRLHVSQPSLSRQIRDLEDEIGVQLLERTAKSVRLTDAGRAFLDEARAILKHTDDAVGKVRAIAGKGETELHVGDWPLATAGSCPASSRLSTSDAEREGEAARLAGREEHRGSARWSIAACDHPSSAQSKRARGAPLRSNWRRRAFVWRFRAIIHSRRRQSVSLADAAREPFIGLMHEEYPRYQEYLARSSRA